MNKSILHTPEGVRDIYNEEMEKREVILSKLNNLVKLYGFKMIDTPTFEYMSVFYTDITLKKPKDLYKFFDKEGNTLVLRPDFTPSIARASSKYFTDDRALRLSYFGNVFANNRRYQGRLKESCQFGGELIGDKSIDADAEIISIVYNAFKACNLNSFMISISHADIIKELIRLGGFDNEKADIITTYISNRNIFDLEKYLKSENCDKKLIKLFSMLHHIYKPYSAKWNELLEYAKDYDKLYDSLKYLDELATILKSYDIIDNISFEPGSISEFDYYTGIIFAGYTEGIGDIVAAGGRYDTLLSNFGKDRPAIGFGIFVEELEKALDNQNVNICPNEAKTVIIYDRAKREEAVNTAKKLRDDNKIAELILANDDIDSIKALYPNDISIMEIR